MIDSYAWRDTREAMLKYGPDDAPVVLIIPPLFEEANRTRHFLVEVMRGLAAIGIASILPDLPGTNDSPIATVDARLDDWKAALATLPAPVATLAVRGGALLEDIGSTALHWRLSPETGARLLRDMLRATAMTVEASPGELEAAARTRPTALAGNLVHPELFVALEGAIPGDSGTIRTVRMEDDAGAADTYLPGAPLWRRAEPTHDPVLAGAVVADFVQWMTSCGVR